MPKPMLTEDYLMRMIAQAAAVLAAILGLRRAGQYPQALAAIDQALEGLMGLPVGLAKNMDDEALIELILGQGTANLARLAALSKLYEQEGEVLSEMGRAAEAGQSWGRALGFMLEAVLGEEGEGGEGVSEAVEALVGKVRLEDLPVGTLYALLSYYEGGARWGEAARVIRRLLEREEAQGDESLRESLREYEGKG